MGLVIAIAVYVFPGKPYATTKNKSGGRSSNLKKPTLGKNDEECNEGEGGDGGACHELPTR